VFKAISTDTDDNYNGSELLGSCHASHCCTFWRAGPGPGCLDCRVHFDRENAMGTSLAFSVQGKTLLTGLLVFEVEKGLICFEFVVGGDKLGTKLCQGSTSILDAFPEHLGGSIRSC